MSSRIVAILALALSSASAQTASPPAADEAAARHQALEDRVAKLVGSGKCGQAQAEATAAGETLMAEQAAEVCGAVKPSGSGGKSGRGGGGGRGGGRGGGGPRGG